MGLDQKSGITIGTMKKGRQNKITDVKGVRVGHCTLNSQQAKTGVTAIIPHEGNLFTEKLLAGASVINGFGKSLGLVQMEELGTLESPILMTNTLSVGAAAEGLVKYMLDQNTEIGRTAGTVNCVVTECNDGSLNDIRALHVREQHVRAALDSAEVDFTEGAVGAGTGMTCMDLKGGIGSASRVLELAGQEYTVGAIVMANFGKPGDLLIAGDPVGSRIQARNHELAETGSIIMVIATDVPLLDRQLKRAAKRAVVGMARTGSFLGNGSGDIAIAFSTANKLPHHAASGPFTIQTVADAQLDNVFRAVAESVEESIISALYHAQSTVGFDGTVRMGLRDYLHRE